MEAAKEGERRERERDRVRKTEMFISAALSEENARLYIERKRETMSEWRD